LAIQRNDGKFAAFGLCVLDVCADSGSSFRLNFSDCFVVFSELQKTVSDVGRSFEFDFWVVRIITVFCAGNLFDGKSAVKFLIYEEKGLILKRLMVIWLILTLLQACETMQMVSQASLKILEKHPIAQVEIDLIINRNVWSKGQKMPVTIEIKNVSPDKIDLKLQSVKFYLSPADSVVSKFEIEAKTENSSRQSYSKRILPLRKREANNLRVVLTEMTRDKSKKNIFDALTEGKYRLWAVVETKEPRTVEGKTKLETAVYEKSVEIELGEGKKLAEFTKNISNKIRVNFNFESLIWRKNELIPLNLKIENLTDEDIFLKIYSAKLTVIGNQNGKQLFGKFDLKIGEKVTLDSIATEIKISRLNSFEEQYSLAHQKWSCLTCQQNSEFWFENLPSGKYIVSFQIEIEDGGNQPNYITSDGYEITFEN
jgi:hypothetical protein